MMKKLAGLSTVLVLTCILLSVSPVFAPCDDLVFNKYIKIDDCWIKVREGSRVYVPMETDVHWMMKIVVSLPSSWSGPVDATVWDRFGAEIEIDQILSITHGIVSTTTKGKSDKVFLTWEIGTLNPGETATLIFEISTDLNPAGHQEYTTPSICEDPETIYELNSGAVLKFKFEGKQYSAYTPQLLVLAMPNFE